jgi:hypothetical protein
MKRYLSAFFVVGSIGMLSLCAQAAIPASTSGEQPAAKKATKKPAVKKTAAPAVIEEDEKEPDVAGTAVIDYQCELGNKLTVFQNNDDDRHIALKWGKRLHRMDRVDTTTGANRFENHHYGLVWIGIPAKAMLLDSIHGHQLANECKTAAQSEPKTTQLPTPTIATKG